LGVADAISFRLRILSYVIIFLKQGRYTALVLEKTNCSFESPNFKLIMEKISISNIVEFRRKSPKSQITFINNLNNPKPKSNPGEGGDYWVHSLSTISSVFKSEKTELLQEKTETLKEKYASSDAKISKDMFQRNIKILSGFEDFRFLRFKPNVKLTYLSKPKDKSILSIKGIPIQVLPQHVFMFEEKDTKKIGAVWFVAKLGGFEKEELSIFCDALYRYLKFNYSKEFEVDMNYCVAIDTVNLNTLRYAKIIEKGFISPLNTTIDLIKKILKVR